ncbi:MAG: hypothetical protein JXB10_12810 [Pirellulales bacterium]|nr:hypothetical protein [Pirellulales bacterium]
MIFSLSSVFRQSGQRDDRRRRLLAEDVTGQGEKKPFSPPGGDASNPHKSDHYGDAEFLSEQPRLIDFLPQRLFSLILAEIMGIVALAGLVGLHFWSLHHPELLPNSGWNPFDLARHGTLGTWISAILLLSSIFIALAIYSIRRHRVDDYQGRYRIWLWAALGLFLFATDLTTGLHGMFQHLLIRWTGTPLWGGGELWWIIPAALLFGALGSRVLVDLWPCGPAITSLLGCGACYTISLLAGLQILVLDDPRQQVLMQHGTALLGHFLLLTAFLYQVRYVRLDAEGLIRHRPKPASSTDGNPAAVPESAASSSTRSDPWRRVDSPQGVPQPVLRRTASAPTAPPAPAPPLQRKLTKQEKKALRERLLRERLKREGKW